MIHLTNLFVFRKITPANIAKNRLKIIISQYRLKNNNIPYYLPELKQDLIKVICKYAQINPKTISIRLENQKNDTSILELNITLNNQKK